MELLLTIIPECLIGVSVFAQLRGRMVHGYSW